MAKSKYIIDKGPILSAYIHINKNIAIYINVNNPLLINEKCFKCNW